MRQDVAVVLRHYRFILVVLVAGLAISVLTALVPSRTRQATAEVTLQPRGLTPLLQQNAAIPDAGTFVRLARDEKVAAEVARRLGRDPSDAQSLLSRTAASAVPLPAGTPPSKTAPTTIRIQATDDSADDAARLANTWAEVVVEKAADVHVDEVALAALQEQADAAEARLNRFTPGTLERREQVLAELGSRRNALAGVRTDASRTEAALSFAQGPGRGLPGDELRFALTGYLGDIAVSVPGSAPEIVRALELRKQSLDSTAERLNAEITTLREEAQPLNLAFEEHQASLYYYQIALRNVEEAELVADRVQVAARVSAPATGKAPGVNWPLRLGGAVAFAVVVGVMGAFALEHAPALRRSTGRTTASAEG